MARMKKQKRQKHTSLSPQLGVHSEPVLSPGKTDVRVARKRPLPPGFGATQSSLASRKREADTSDVPRPRKRRNLGLTRTANSASQSPEAVRPRRGLDPVRIDPDDAQVEREAFDAVRGFSRGFSPRRRQPKRGPITRSSGRRASHQSDEQLDEFLPGDSDFRPATPKVNSVNSPMQDLNRGASPDLGTDVEIPEFRSPPSVPAPTRTPGQVSDIVVATSQPVPEADPTPARSDTRPNASQMSHVGRSVVTSLQRVPRPPKMRTIVLDGDADFVLSDSERHRITDAMYEVPLGSSPEPEAIVHKEVQPEREARRKSVRTRLKKPAQGSGAKDSQREPTALGSQRRRGDDDHRASGFVTRLLNGVPVVEVNSSHLYKLRDWLGLDNQQGWALALRDALESNSTRLALQSKAAEKLVARIRLLLKDSERAPKAPYLAEQAKWLKLRQTDHTQSISIIEETIAKVLAQSDELTEVISWRELVYCVVPALFHVLWETIMLGGSYRHEDRQLLPNSTLSLTSTVLHRLVSLARWLNELAFACEKFFENDDEEEIWVSAKRGGGRSFAEHMRMSMMTFDKASSKLEAFEAAIRTREEEEARRELGKRHQLATEEARKRALLAEEQAQREAAVQEELAEIAAKQERYEAMCRSLSNMRETNHFQHERVQKALGLWPPGFATRHQPTQPPSASSRAGPSALRSASKPVSSQFALRGTHDGIDPRPLQVSFGQRPTQEIPLQTAFPARPGALADGGLVIGSAQAPRPPPEQDDGPQVISSDSDSLDGYLPSLTPNVAPTEGALEAAPDSSPSPAFDLAPGAALSSTTSPIPSPGHSPEFVSAPSLVPVDAAWAEDDIEYLADELSHLPDDPSPKDIETWAEILDRSHEEVAAQIKMLMQHED